MFLLIALVLVALSAADPSSSGEGELNEGADSWPELGEPLVPSDFGGHGPLEEEDRREEEYDVEDDKNPNAEESTKSVVEEEGAPGSVEDEEKDEEEEEEVKKPSDGDDEEQKPPGSVFDTPLFDLNRLTRYFKQLESAVEKVFRADGSRNGTEFSDVTEEEVDSDGNKLLVHESVVKTEDGGTNSSVVVEAVNGRTKRSNSDSMRIQ